MERNHSHSWPVTRTKGVELAAKVAADLELSSKRGMTLAGHDSINITGLVPTVMLFVPNVDGISHNEHEYTTAADIVAGPAMGVVREKVDGLTIVFIQWSEVPRSSAAKLGPGLVTGGPMAPRSVDGDVDACKSPLWWLRNCATMSAWMLKHLRRRS